MFVMVNTVITMERPDADEVSDEEFEDDEDNDI